MKEINTAKMMRLHREKSSRRSDEKIRSDVKMWDEYKEKYIAETKEITDAYQAEADKLNATIAEVEGRSHERTIDADSIANAINDIEMRLGIAKKHLEGVSVDVDINASEFPAAYSYKPMSTHFTMVYKSGAWKIKSIERERCTKTLYAFNLTDEAKQAIIEKYTVIKA